MKNNTLLNQNPADGGGGSTPPATPPAQPPTPPTPPAIPPGYMTQEEANKLVEKARQQEKDKLYPEIERYKSKTTELEGKLTAIAAAKTADGQAVDVQKLVTEVAASTERVVTEKLKEQIAALETQNRETNGQVTTLRLERYKAAKITAAGGEANLIPSLIRGSTEAEIDASIEESRKQFEAIKARLQPTTLQTPPGNGQQPPTAPPAIPAGGAPAATAPGATTGTPQVKNMSVKDYAKERDKLRSETAARYAQV